MSQAPKKIEPQSALVISKVELDSGFTRIVAKHKNAAGDSLIKEENIGGYIKLLPNTAEGFPGAIKRSISIADANNEEGSFTLDFVSHGGGGPAEQWNARVSAGDSLHFLGPGPAADVEITAKTFFLVADPSAFPAMKRQISRISKTDFTSCQVTLLSENKMAPNYFEEFLGLKGMSFKLTTQEGLNADELIGKVQKEGSDFWAAGERLMVNSLRKAIKKREKSGDLKLAHKYISSYWQNGLVQEDHSKLKRQDKVDS